MRKKILGHLFCGAIFLLYCYSFTDAESDEKNRQTFVIRYKEGEQTIPVTVVLDYNKQTEYVINMNPRTPAKSVTLYDFKQCGVPCFSGMRHGLVYRLIPDDCWSDDYWTYLSQRTIAYKDLTNRECFLGRLTHETLNEESNALQDVKSPVESKPKVRSLDPGRSALTPTEIRNIAGQKTAIFCRKMNTWLLMPEKVHGISKRDADEYEERTYQHHGYHTVQYSHYGHETRRRYRNPNRVNNSSHRSHRRQSPAESENKRFEIPVPSALPSDHQLNLPSANGFRAHDNVANVSENEDLYSDNHNIRRPNTDDNPHSLKHSKSSEAEKKKLYSGNALTKIGTSDPSDTNKNRFGYKIKHPTFEAEFSSAFGIPTNSRSNNNATENLDFIKNDDISVFNHGRVPHHSTFSSSKGSSLPLISEGNAHSRTERATSTTDVPTVSQNKEINHPNLHPSLAHLLPVYKPLRQEFEFDSPNGHAFPLDNNQKSTERELSPFSPSSREPSKHGFTNHSDGHSTSLDSDVSTNVLEIPRITKEFENIKSNEKYLPVPQSTNSSRVFKSHILPDVYSPASHIHPANVPSYRTNNNLQQEIASPVPHSSFAGRNHITNSRHNIHLEENIPYIPPSEILSTTTESFVLTTPDYFVAHRLSNNLSNPPRQTTYQTAENINSFRKIPNHVSNNYAHSIPSEDKSLKHPILKSDGIFGNENSNENIQNSFLTTEYPFTQREYKSNSDHRSDIPSEDKDRLSSPEQTRTNQGRRTYPSLVPNETSIEGIPPYQIRYQSVLRDFKPDEIIIDIENIPTHPPPPVTSSFHQRILTTVQPTIRTLSTESARRDIAIRGEQNSGTTWRTFIPTTRQPRRRINDRTRRPVQHQPSFFVQKSHNRQFIRPPNQIDRNRHFISAQHPNRNHVRYSGRLNPPSNVQMPPQMNQPQHFNQFNSLPPGISVHPRHPQAPYADMVHSNRPPTMPFVNENQSVMKPHRQRHHRKKDRLANSCCRFRGKSSDLQSCCRNGGPCCTRAHRRMQPPGAPCCSPTQTAGQGLPANQIQTPLRTTNKSQQPRRPINQIQSSLRTANQIQPLLRTTNQIQSPIRTVDHIQPLPRTSLHNQPPPKSEVDSKDRCQKEKMCRTLYESTQQVMVCRNVLIEGC